MSKEDIRFLRKLLLESALSCRRESRVHGRGEWGRGFFKGRQGGFLMASRWLRISQKIANKRRKERKLYG